MKLIEIGPSYNPVLPKRDGWLTTVVDHADRQYPVEKYSAEDLSSQNIEEVDVIWSGGSLAARFPSSALGTYDAILASHVMEHMPDPISFLLSAQELLKPSGKVVLALPDRRYTFDYFQPMTTTADWLVAYDHRARTHSRRAAFNHMVYNVSNGIKATWGSTEKLSDLLLTLDLSDAATHFDINTDSGGGDHYHDYHAWHFTPSSFQLLMLESAVLRHIDLRVASCSDAIGHEFFATVVRGRAHEAAETLNVTRMQLLKAMALEFRTGTDLLV